METPPGAEDEQAVTTEVDLSASTLRFDGGVRANLKEFVGVLRQGDDASLEKAVVQLSKLHRWLAPVALIVGAVLMLFQGLKLLFANWRLTLVQVLPAMWIWAGMLDLKLHLLHGVSLHVVSGPDPTRCSSWASSCSPWRSPCRPARRARSRPSR